MKITRSTLRADGFTVGQALDREAAFLRSIGIPAKNDALTFDEQQEEFREFMRRAVLVAMDFCAASLEQTGPKDAELPGLFAGIDPIAERIFNDSLSLQSSTS